MKIKNLVYIFFTIAITLSSCKKNDEVVENANDNEDGFITMEIGGTNYKSVTKDDFNNYSDTSNWNLYPGGILSIDTTNSFNGQSSIKLVSTDQCFHVEKIEGVPVKRDKVYVMHFHYNLPITTIEELNNGLGWTCMGPFRLELKQGNEVILSEWLDQIDTWTEKNFYFQPINNVPVKIELLVGTKKGIWIDDLIVLKEY